VDADTPSVFLITRGAVFDKVMSNLEEIKARGGPVIAIASEGDEEVAAMADDVIFVPEVPNTPTVGDVVPCNCWPITSPFSAAATWTNPQPRQERHGGVAGSQESGVSENGMRIDADFADCAG